MVLKDLFWKLQNFSTTQPGLCVYLEDLSRTFVIYFLQINRNHFLITLQTYCTVKK